MVQFDTVIFRKTLELFWSVQFVWIEKKVTIIIIAFHFMKRRLKNGYLNCAKIKESRSMVYGFP